MADKVKKDTSVKIKTLMGYHPHFVLVINDERFAQLHFSSPDKNAMSMYMEGYLRGRRIPGLEFDDHDGDLDYSLHSMIMF